MSLRTGRIPSIQDLKVLLQGTSFNDARVPLLVKAVGRAENNVLSDRRVFEPWSILSAKACRQETDGTYKGSARSTQPGGGLCRT